MKADEIRAEWRRVAEAAETSGVPPDNVELLKLGALMEIAGQLADLNERWNVLPAQAEKCSGKMRPRGRRTDRTAPPQAVRGR